MKKVLSAILAGAMAVTMAVPALAAGSTDSLKYALDSDGEINEDVYAKSDDGKWHRTPGLGDVKIDGVVPNAEVYIALGNGMSDFAKGEKLTGEDLYFAKVTTNAKENEEDDTTYTIEPVDTIDEATHYDTSKIAEDDKAKDISGLKTVKPGDYITLNSLCNEDYFKFDVDKDDGGKYIKKIEVVDDKKLGNLPRTAYLKFILNDSTTTSDLKSNGTLTFKAKGSSADFRDKSGSKKLTAKDEKWDDDLEIEIDYTLWINNEKATNDDNPDSGDRVYFDPDDNEDNTLIWGDDRAGLFFEGNDDAGKFYARLSTKSHSEVYATYGDPVNADLWFFDFVGNSTIPATSRATLTLGIPWDEDDDYTPNPEDCYIYEQLDDGTMVDVTERFIYSEDNDGTTDIEGWSTKTRTLGTYIISDTELDLEVIEEVEEEDVTDDDTADITTEDDQKEIPNTGSSDMVGAAMAAAIVSLSAAGAVAFKKASK